MKYKNEAETKKNFKRQLAMLGKPTEEIEEAAELSCVLDATYSAFFELSTTRSIGFGIGFIPWTAIKDYIVYRGYDAYYAHFFERAIREMDNKYVELKNNDIKSNTSSNKPTRTGKR